MDLTQAIWDPETLFQIADYNDSNLVQCVGQAKSKHGSRCRWNIPQSYHGEIYAILARLAQKSPAEVKAADLQPLAKLCLCRDYHSWQVNDVVRRWQTVVGRAGSYSNPSSRESTPQSDDDSTMTDERQRCLTELGETVDPSITMDIIIREKMSALNTETARLSQELAETKRSLAAAEYDGQVLQEQLRISQEYAHSLAQKIRKMEAEHQDVLSRRSAELTDVKKQLKESRESEAQRRTSISNMQEEVERLKGEADQEKKRRDDQEKKLLKIIDRLSETSSQQEKDLKKAQSLLDASREDNTKLKAENSRATQEFHAAREALNDTRDDKARLTAALRSLQQSQKELGESREEKAQLEQDVKALGERIAEMDVRFNDKPTVETGDSEGFPGESKKARQRGRFSIRHFWRGRRRDHFP